MIVILIGYMASGKSTIGRDLADKVNYQFVDLDDYIEEREKMSIVDLFKTKGEIYFRKIESIYLKEIIADKDDIILSLGGGTPCYGQNMSFLQKASKVSSIYLKASIGALINRLENEKSKRPLVAHLKTEEELGEFIGKHLFERNQFYSLADETIVTDVLSTKEIVEAIRIKLF